MLWSRAALGLKRLPVHGKAAFVNRRIITQNYGPHTTYFQQPPPPEAPSRSRKFLTWTLVGGLSVALGWSLHAVLTDTELFPDEYVEMVADEGPGMRQREMTALAQIENARIMPMFDSGLTRFIFDIHRGWSTATKAIGHSCQVPSNLPCEDYHTSCTTAILEDPTQDWAYWGIYDGHAGPRTAFMLQQWLMQFLTGYLEKDHCYGKPYTPNDPQTIKSIKDAFLALDAEIMRNATQAVTGARDMLNGSFAPQPVGPADARAMRAHLMGPALSGSCALVAMFDPANSVLRVANVGDSRAVLGSWNDATGSYTAQPMSIDQTGFNPDEVARLKRAHPDEDNIVDPESGRVHGIAVSRAFGDSRWKWPQELSKRCHDMFWGPRPRPDRMILTPPYLTAEPEIMERKVKTEGAHPDFLIMASDGLWDLMSCEDAVTCVEQWLTKFRPDNFRSALQDHAAALDFEPAMLNELNGDYLNSAENRATDEDTYFDEKEGVLKWRVSPEHFVVEDDHCGVHLIKNALGGKRRNLLHGVLSVQPPLSRDVRDDITVEVIFFGDYHVAISNGEPSGRLALMLPPPSKSS